MLNKSHAEALGTLVAEGRIWRVSPAGRTGFGAGIVWGRGGAWRRWKSGRHYLFEKCVLCFIAWKKRYFTGGISVFRADITEK